MLGALTDGTENLIYLSDRGFRREVDGGVEVGDLGVEDQWLALVRWAGSSNDRLPTGWLAHLGRLGRGAEHLALNGVQEGSNLNHLIRGSVVVSAEPATSSARRESAAASCEGRSERAEGGSARAPKQTLTGPPLEQARE